MVTGSVDDSTCPSFNRKATSLFPAVRVPVRFIVKEPLVTSKALPANVPSVVTKEVVSPGYCFTRIMAPSGMVPRMFRFHVVSVVFISPSDSTLGAPVTSTESSGIWNISS